MLECIFTTDNSSTMSDGCGNVVFKVGDFKTKLKDGIGYGSLPSVPLQTLICRLFSI